MAARSRLLLIALVAALASACAAASPSPSIEVSQEPSASAEATKPQGSAPVEPSAKPCVPGFVCNAELAPGDYTSTSTGATITFSLTGDSWSGLEDTDQDGFALFTTDAAAAHGISVVVFTGGIFSEVCSPDQTETIGSSPADFIAFLSAVEGVAAEAPIDVEVGGRPAIRVDLTTDSPCTDPDRMWLWTLPVHGDFHFNDNEKVRVFAIDAGSVTVLIVVEAFLDADYPVLLQKTDELIATMTIEAAP